MSTGTAFDVIFNVFSDLSGGLVNDLASAMTAIIVIMVIVMGLDVLYVTLLSPYVDKFNQELDYKDYKRKRERAESFKSRYQKEHPSDGGQ